MLYQAPQVIWTDVNNDVLVDWSEYHPSARSYFNNKLNSYIIRDNPDNNPNKPYVVSYGGREFKEFKTIDEAKQWVEEVHFPSVIVKAGFKPHE